MNAELLAAVNMVTNILSQADGNMAQTMFAMIGAAIGGGVFLSKIFGR